MTHIFRPEWREMQKWREQANRAAAQLKKVAIDKDPVKLGFVFDDGVITVSVPAQTIRDLDEQKLADHFYETVLTAAQTGGNA